MIAIGMAQQLRAAGLTWEPQPYDFFAVPERGMDDRVFVLSDVMCYIEKRGERVLVTFHGALEWALDYVLQEEVVWLPREEQVRDELERRLIGQPRPQLTLSTTRDGYRCEFQVGGDNLAFEHWGAAEAYGAGLLHLLQQGVGAP